MIRKTFTYTDFDGEERTEPFYFNLTEAELVELEMRFGGVNKMLKEIQEAEDGYRVTQAIRDIICAAYGEKSSDGRRFMKNKEIFDSFRATEAYSVLFTELLPLLLTVITELPLLTPCHYHPLRPSQCQLPEAEGEEHGGYRATPAECHDGGTA